MLITSRLTNSGLATRAIAMINPTYLLTAKSDEKIQLTGFIANSCYDSCDFKCDFVQLYIILLLDRAQRLFKYRTLFSDISSITKEIIAL